MVWGFLSGPGRDGNARIAAGLAIASLAGLELAIREHVTGFRSHTTMLAGAAALAAVALLGVGAGLNVLPVLLAAGLAAFGGVVLRAARAVQAPLRRAQLPVRACCARGARVPSSS